MFFDQEAIGAFTSEIAGASGAQGRERPVLSAVCELCEQSGNGWRATTSRHAAVSRLNCSAFRESRRFAVRAGMYRDSRSTLEAALQGNRTAAHRISPHSRPLKNETLGNHCFFWLLVLH